MKIELRPLAEIKPYEKNPRINDAAVDAVAESIRRFGFRQPIVVDGDGVIVCGHTRWKAAQKLGLADVPVHVATDLTPEQIRAYRIADNKTAELAEWNLDLLPIEMAELKDAGIDWSLLGFDQDELAKLLDPGVNQGLTDPDEIPESPDEAITQPGDLWIMGDHRLLCGDSGSVADVDFLIAVDPAKALELPIGSDIKPALLPIHLVNTDPPYNVKVEPRSNNAIAAGLGEVIGERQLHRHRTRAGLRITSTADPRNIDLLRYVAWLVAERYKPKPEPEGLTGCDAHKDRAAQRNRDLSMSGRDIGEMPAVVNAEKKQKAERDFRFFCEQYFPATFHLPWSPDHLKVVAKIEQAVLEGGLFAMAMPRGSGKTSMCETACLWALLYGHREFVALIGSDEEHASNMLESIKAELENNELLLEDFPEVVFPIQALEGIHQRAGGQLYQGKQTHIGWTAREIVLPTIPDSKASGSIIRVAGITGRIRGMKHKRVDGTSVRPSLVLIDDPQTDESARSPSQCATRERILAGAILGLGGPGRKIAGLMTLTVVRPDDLADRILDRDKHPQWQGERTKMVYSFPANESLWAKYAELWREGMRADRGIADATEFYRANREAMDEGADVAWAERHHPDELSAIQHAMNLKLDRGEAAFWAEYQNEPLPEEHADDDLLTADQIAAKVSGLKRGEVPIGCTHLTMFVDVQGKALFWLVAAWEDDFTGYVIDYGTEPDQKAAYFTLRDIRHTLASAAARAGVEGAIYAGLERLTEATLGREWRRDDGAMVRIDRCLIDANWGSSSDVVYQFSRQSKHASIVMPAHGRYVGASSIPFSDYRRKRGDRVGLNWRIPVVTGKRSVRHAVFDTNYWKSFVHARLAVPMGDPGCLSSFGRKPEQHRLLAEHLTSEYRVKTEGRGRTVDEWKLRVDGLDNHWLDCLVGCAVAASIQGAVLFGTDTKPTTRPRIRLSALQEARR